MGWLQDWMIRAGLVDPDRPPAEGDHRRWLQAGRQGLLAAAVLVVAGGVLAFLAEGALRVVGLVVLAAGVVTAGLLTASILGSRRALREEGDTR